MKSFLTGLGTGLAIGIFVAPQRGVETRRQIANKAGELGDRAGEQVNRLKQAAGDPQKVIGKFKRQTKAYRARVKDAARNAAEQLKDAAQSLASKAGVGPLAMLNTGSREDLLRVYGIGPVLADKIIHGRPYISEQEVVEREILSESTLKELQRSMKSA
ncbi:MAG TPA: YtxH domain-containing protein [Terriglobales bacterium]